jgi:hypothetical protein
MLRLTIVFVLWLASTAHSVEELEARLQRDADRHWEVYRRAISEVPQRRLTDTNVRTIFAPDHGCPGRSAQGRAEQG